MFSIDHHVKMRQIELAQSIKSVKKVYLDARFWIIMRDVDLGVETRPAAVELVQLLRSGVSSGRLLCPVSESTFLEVLKQAPTATRRQATAKIIDELSGGVSLISGRMRIGTEIAHFFYRNGGQTNLYDLQELVWTKLAYAMGYVHPMLDNLEAAVLHIQKGFFDRMWRAPLTEIIDSIGPKVMDEEARELSHAALRVDSGIKAHEADLVSFKRLYRDEVRGAIDISGGLILEALDAITERATGSPIALDAPGRKEFSNVGRNILAVAFERSLAQDTLRTIHSLASFHAGLRWGRRTMFSANHFYDFEHAAGAVAYCDAFFTEGFMANLINAGHIRLDRLNNCRTTNELPEAIEILRQL